MKITSSAFAHNGWIPTKHTCEGEDVSPPLLWSDLPKGTRTLALIVDDPDAPDPAAPRMTWVHWLIYDLPATTTGLPEGVSNTALPPGTKRGRNDWNKTGYGGPCPPIGRHRYFHKLYALSVVLGDLGEPTKAQVERAMENHVLAKAELVGLYQKGVKAAAVAPKGAPAKAAPAAKAKASSKKAAPAKPKAKAAAKAKPATKPKAKAKRAPAAKPSNKAAAKTKKKR